MYDAVIVGSGPNGLAAAVVLAEAGKRVLVLEGRDTIGGGTRTEELTEPGVHHDVCSSVHPFGIGSPLFSSLPLGSHGLEWAHPPVPFAHALPDGESVLVYRSLDETVAGLGPDGEAWRRLIGPLVDDWPAIARLATAPPLRAALSPIRGLRVARRALRSGTHLAGWFATERGRAVIGGLSAHSVAPLDTNGVGGVVAVLAAAAHAVGWPFAVRGSASITQALASHLGTLGGEIRTGLWVKGLGDLPDARVLIFDTSPQQAAAIAGDRISWWRRSRYRTLPTGPGTFKTDIATDGSIPWEDPRLGEAGTVHIGGTFEEIAEAEAKVAGGEHPDRPFVLLSQPLTGDRGRAPQGTGIVWAYCHLPASSTEDMSGRIVAQIERFAPGFESRIRAISCRGPEDFDDYNPNFIHGDITGGPISLTGLLRRPTLLRPYRAGPGIYLCSAATPPGAGVHGMCGYWAAKAALKELG